ncbi:MAG: hypothetical protein NT154_33320 [Verrucomicrobia bacterium]|nr:hypothetical protein [Verrucomicrobiota bacterium]
MKQEPKPGARLEPQDFETVIRSTPLIAIDLVVRSADGRVLLGRRRNEPAKGCLFVVLADEVTSPVQDALRPMDQDGEYAWKTEVELLNCPDVHLHAKAYFSSAKAGCQGGPG